MPAAMKTEALLTLSQWLSPAFPIGAFAYSHGLETAIRDALVSDAESLQNWLCDLLEIGSAKSDLVLLSAAHGSATPVELDQLALAFQPSRERREEAIAMGAAFCRTARDVWELELPDLTYPVAIGQAASMQEIPLIETAALYAQAFVGNLVSAAIRLVPLGQTEGQAVLAALQPTVEALGRESVDLTLDDLASAAFLSDVQAMRHETQSPRIFQS